jgi:pimeloyl-[acyl-carrier protein] methyl ester esterase
MYYLNAEKSIRWHYTEHGEGDPLLFFHGWGVDGQVWRQQRKYFSKKYRVLTVDLPGHGKSEGQAMTLAQMAGDLRDLMDHLGLQDVRVVGSSFGGLLAIKMVGLYPQRFKCLILVGSQPKFSWAQDYPYGLGQGQIQKLSLQLCSDYPAIVDIFFRSLFTRQERVSRRFHWVQIFRRHQRYPDQEALLGYLAILADTDLRLTFAKISLPVQFINGTEDMICPRESYLTLAAVMPQARFDWLEGCGHFPFLSRPREFNGMLEGFLVKVNQGYVVAGA